MSDAAAGTDLVQLTIDGKEIAVPKGTLIIRAAEELGIVIPRFCDHPLLDPVAACRQCLVEVEGQRKPMTACSTTVMPDAVVKTHLTSEVARKGQEGQLEFLLINHPLDCPQCDKGGECPLQDQALAHGPGDTRMLDHKRRYDKPLPISPLIALDRERCVLCARCTRFSSEISGDPFIELFERGALEQVAIYADEPYISYFSGNVSQICPVGALTTTPYRFLARPFDLRTTKTICTQCSAGCNLRTDTRRGEIQRQLAADNMAVNEMWNCDRGRFAYEYVASPERFAHPMVRGAVSNLEPTSWHKALTAAATAIKGALDDGGPSTVGVITGGRLTDEDSYAVSRYARDVLGTDNVDFRLDPRTEEERDVLSAVAGTVGPTYDDVEAADVVVLAGLDPEDEVPILYLRLRKAWRKNRQKIVVVGPWLGSLAEIDWRWIPTAAGEEAATLAALGTGDSEALADVDEALAGGSVVVLAGERLAQSPGGLHAAAGLATRVDAPFAWVPRRTNSRGAVDAGLVPGLLPGGRTLAEPGPVGDAWSRLPDEPGLDTRGMLQAAAEGRLRVLHLIGVDPARDFDDPALAALALERVETLIVQDILPTASSRHADIVLAAAAAQERVGSFTTWEGRRQPFARAVPASGVVQEDWDILRQLARALEVDLGWETAMDVRREAAPLMESDAPAAPGLAAVGPPPAPEVPEADADEFSAIVVPQLLGAGTMLLGAKQLAETRRRPRVAVNEADARRVGLVHGAAATVTGPGGSVELPVDVTGDVVAGTVVLPRHTEAEPVGLIAQTHTEGAPGPLRVRLAAAADANADATNGGEG